LFIHGTVEIKPFALDENIRLIHPDSTTWSTFMCVKGSFQLRDKSEHPPINCTVIDTNAALREHFFEVSIAKIISNPNVAKN
jgi:hypothetical protein